MVSLGSGRGSAYLAHYCLFLVQYMKTWVQLCEHVAWHIARRRCARVVIGHYSVLAPLIVRLRKFKTVIYVRLWLCYLPLTPRNLLWENLRHMYIFEKLLGSFRWNVVSDYN
jgi:hypothetical protein